MQDRYVGDIGDFGKYGLLRALCGRDLYLGVVWYLIPDEGGLDYGSAKVEVKSTSLVQSWKSEKKSKPQFTIKAAGRWDEATGKWLHVAPERAADIYVFCVFDPQDEASPNPLDVGEWRFFAVSTKRLAEAFGDQKSVRLSRVQEIEEAVGYSRLHERVDLELRAGN